MKIFQYYLPTKQLLINRLMLKFFSFDSITKGQNGKLKVESEENKRTTFSIELKNKLKVV